MQIGKPFNPYKQFVGSFIPNWLLCRTEVSPGAKLCYGRLMQHAGKNGECFPRQSIVGEELGVSRRQIIRYLEELEKFKLVKAVQSGLRKPNQYLFLWHKWITENGEIPDVTDMSLPDRSEVTDMSLPDATDMSLPTNVLLKESVEENPSPNGESTKGKKKSQEVPKQNPEFTIFITRWYAEYRTKFGDKYFFQTGKDGAALKRLLRDSGLNVEELISIAKQAWDRPTGFNSKFAATICGFASRINDIRVELKSLHPNGRAQAPERVGVF